MNEFTEEKYESVLACWHLMDRDLASKDYTQPQEFVRTGEILYADGLRKDAFDSYRKAVRMLGGGTGVRDLDPSELELLAVLQYRIGVMYLHGDGCIESELTAAKYLEDSAEYGYVPAYYPLAMVSLRTGEEEKAAYYLREGARRRDTACQRMLGNAYYTGDILPGVEKDLKTAIRFYMEGACPDDLSAGDAQCQYMLGKILEENGRNHSARMRKLLAESGFVSGVMKDPVFWLETAARRGSGDAAALLNRLQWGIPGTDAGAFVRKEEEAGNEVSADKKDAPEEVKITYAGDENPLSGEKTVKKESICLLNSDGERNLYFAKSLPAEKYSVQICAQKSMAQVLREIVEQYTAEGNLLELPEILLMALDENERKNMYDALEVLRTATKLHAQTGAMAADAADRSEDGVRTEKDSADTDRLFYFLSDRLRMYVCGRGASCAPVLDSACTRMGDFYIPLYLCDPDQMASAWLLDRLPLFIPCLKGYSSRMDTVVFGDHPGIVRLCKDAIAAAQISEIPFSLTVIGENADELESGESVLFCTR